MKSGHWPLSLSSPCRCPCPCVCATSCSWNMLESWIYSDIVLYFDLHDHEVLHLAVGIKCLFQSLNGTQVKLCFFIIEWPMLEATIGFNLATFEMRWLRFCDIEWSLQECMFAFDGVLPGSLEGTRNDSWQDFTWHRSFVRQNSDLTMEWISRLFRSFSPSYGNQQECKSWEVILFGSVKKETGSLSFGRICKMTKPAFWKKKLE